MISDNLLVTILSPIRLNNKLFLAQTQYCYVRTVVVEEKCCGFHNEYVFLSEAVEYQVQEKNATLGYECIAETFDYVRNNVMWLDQTTDYDAEGLPYKRMKPNTCKIQEKANKIYM